jgi:hypothetical protein
MKRFLLRAWGRDLAQIAEAFPPDVVEREDGAAGWFFATRDEREAFRAVIRCTSVLGAMSGSGPMVITSAVDGGFDEDGELIEVHKRTYAHITLRLPDGREASFRHGYGYGYPQHSVEFMWREGNYSCDCNKRLFLARECGIGSEDDPVECGDTIELVALEVTKGEPA